MSGLSRFKNVLLKLKFRFIWGLKDVSPDTEVFSRSLWLCEKSKILTSTIWFQNVNVFLETIKQQYLILNSFKVYMTDFFYLLDHIFMFFS